jgi:hypothetical protein
MLKRHFCRHDQLLTHIVATGASARETRRQRGVASRRPTCPPVSRGTVLSARE